MIQLLAQSQVKTILGLQYRLNSIVDQMWVEKKFPYLRAAFVEAAEALDHYGWKWWKQQASDIPQVKIEISDILHFYLSDLLISTSGDIDQAAMIFEKECGDSTDEVHLDGTAYSPTKLDVQSLFELLAAFSVLRKRNFAIFQEIMLRCDLDWHSLYVNYVSKNVLNIFRQDHGYKDGSYVKMWEGREDNEHLAEISASLDAGSSSYSEDIYSLLSKKYSSLK
ncbi:dUTP diphosphatase [Pseudomonas aeruginosa]|nr:dUTP diphosphatase [Pseudomonas aeruginosa]